MSGTSRCECAIQGGELVPSPAGLGETLRGVWLGELRVVWMNKSRRQKFGDEKPQCCDDRV